MTLGQLKSLVEGYFPVRVKEIREDWGEQGQVLVIIEAGIQEGAPNTPPTTEEIETFLKSKTPITVEIFVSYV